MKKYTFSATESKEMKKYEEEFDKTPFGKKAKLWIKIIAWFGILGIIFFLITGLILIFEDNNISDFVEIIGIAILVINFMCVALGYLVYQAMLMNYVNSKK